MHGVMNGVRKSKIIHVRAWNAGVYARDMGTQSSGVGKHLNKLRSTGDLTLVLSTGALLSTLPFPPAAFKDCCLTWFTNPSHITVHKTVLFSKTMFDRSRGCYTCHCVTDPTSSMQDGAHRTFLSLEGHLYRLPIVAGAARGACSLCTRWGGGGGLLPLRDGVCTSCWLGCNRGGRGGGCNIPGYAPQ